METTTTETSAVAQPTVDEDYNRPEITKEIEDRVLAEMQNEIIALNELNGEWCLNTGEAFTRQWSEITNALMQTIENNDGDSDDSSSTTSFTQFQEDKVFIISLLGNTSCGKSFVARHLFVDEPNEDTIGAPVIIDENEKKGATTGNVNCYVSRSDTNNKILVLDYEGEKGSAFPLSLYFRRGLAHLTGSVEKARKRRQAVTDYFPKLAYILSDVIILLGNEDFASTDYLTRCREFALKANDGVSQIPYRPVLIIIQNKSSLAQSVSSDIVTKKFFDIHGQEALPLKQYFSDVKCFCLPHTEYLQRNKGMVLDGREIFGTQMADLKTLFTIMRQCNSERMLTHAQWLYLLQRVLEIVQSGSSVSLHTLLSEIVDHDDDSAIQITVSGFLFRYSNKDIHSPQWFNTCCKYAIRILTHCLAVKAYTKRELMSERIINEQCENALKALSTKLDDFRPCEALYPGKGRSSKNGENEQPVYCYQHKGAHEEVHRTCKSVYGLSAWKEFWGWSSTDVWPGSFFTPTNGERTIAVLSMDLTVGLSRSVRDLMVTFQQDPTAIYNFFIDLFNFKNDNYPQRVFSRVCFCTKNPLQGLSSVCNVQTNTKLRPNRLNWVLKHQIELFLTSKSLYRHKCQTCYEALESAWEERISRQNSLRNASSLQMDNEELECVICFSNERDFLFIPCGHRGFCERCTSKVLNERSRCPICNSAITGKQRVHDV